MGKTHRGALELTDTGTNSGLFLDNGNTTQPTTNGQICYVSGTGIRAYVEGAAITIGAAGVGGVSTWDEVYDTDKILAIDDGTLTFTVTGNTAGLTLNKSATGAGAPLVIANAGTGNDITGPSWSVISTGSVGILELTSAGTINATGGALTIGATATATTLAGTCVIAGGATANALTITAGDVLLSDGSITVTDADDAATLSVTNTGATTAVGVVAIVADAVTTGNVIDVNADAVTSGTLLHLDTTAATFTGKYIDCYDGVASDFTVGLYGATTIAGAAANNVFVITAGDAVLSAGGITVTKAANNATLSITNNTATTASVVALAGSGVFTGSTTTSWMTITASGLTTGTGVYVPFAALTTGKGVHAYASALTTGSLIYANQDGEALAAGELLTIDNTESGTLTAKTGNLCSISSSMTETAASRTEDYDTLLISRTDVSNLLAITYTATGSILKLSKTSTQTLGTLTDSVIGLEVSMPALCTGAGVSVTHAAPTGSCFVGANNATTTGIGGLSLTHTTAVITTGSVAKISSTSVDTGTGQGTLLDLVSSGTTASTPVQLTTAALATGTAMTITANALTTGTALTLTSTGTIITTGEMLSIVANSATTATGLLRVSGTALTDGWVAELTGGGATTTASGGVLNVQAGASTNGAALQVVSSGAILAASVGMVMLTANALTTGDVVRMSATAQTTGNLISLTGGGATLATGGSIIRANMGAATAGSGLEVVTTGIYTGTDGLVNLTANSATSGDVMVISGTGLVDGCALKIAATEATLTTGHYVEFYDGATNDFTIGKYGATVIAGNAATTVLTVTAGDVVVSDGAIGVANEAVTVAAAATTFAVDSNLVTLTGDAGGNTVATITGGVSGQLLTLIFVDALVTITDNNTHAANSIDLSAAFTSADDTTLQLVFDGTSWYEISRSVN